MNAPAVQAEPATPFAAQARLRGDARALRLAFSDDVRAPAQRRAVVVQLEGEAQASILSQLPAAPNLADLPDLALEDGDRILVPHRPAMVSVFGSVYNESAFVHRPEKTVTDYLEQAGGPKKEADRRNMFLLRADGSVVPNKGGWFGGGQLASLSPLPGDSIVVPEDLYRTTLTKDLKDWTQIFYQFGLGAAALKVIGD